MQVRAVMQKSKKIMVRVARGALELMLSVIVIAVFAVTIYNYPGYMRTLQMGGNNPVDAKVGTIEGKSINDAKARKFEIEVTNDLANEAMMIGPVQLEFEDQKDKVHSEEIFLQPIVPKEAKNTSSSKEASARSDMDPMVYALEFNDEDMKELERNVEISMKATMGPAEAMPTEVMTQPEDSVKLAI
jgi:hypothetical protein